MATSGFDSLDKLVGGSGYPERSAVLILGPPGIGKEALCYRFAYAGLQAGAFCAYASTLTVSDILQDMKAFGVETTERVPLWYTVSGGQLAYNVNDLSSISFNIKELLKQNGQRSCRIVVDSFSPLLMLNPPDSVYRFLGQLITELKAYDAVLFGTIEEGMHPPEVTAAMQQLFDGVIELKFYEEGFKLLPLMRIRKMRGSLPQPGYYRFSVTRSDMEISAYVK